MNHAAFPLDDLEDCKEGNTMDGMQYLASVMKQAKSMPKVSRANSSLSLQQRQTVFLSAEVAVVGRLEPRDGNETAWIDAFGGQYCAMKRRMDEMVNAKTGRQALPASLKDRIYWKRFVREREPTLDVLARFDQVAVSVFIENVRSWLCDEQPPLEVTEGLCSWLFAIVAMMREPLDPDTQSDIQAIARCINNANIQDEHVYACARVVLASIVTMESATRW